MTVPNVGIASYQINLSRPVISFNTNSVTIVLNFNVSGTLGSTPFNYKFSASPTISIPTSTLETDKILAALENLQAALEALPNIPDWVKDLVYEQYSEFKPYIYPSYLIGSLNDISFIRERALTITNVTLTQSVQNNKLLLKVNITVNPGSVNIRVNFYSNGDDDVIYIYSNVDCYIEDIKIYEDGHPDGEITIPSNHFECLRGNTVMELNGDYFLSQAVYVAKIRFKTNSTIYWFEYAVLGNGSGLQPPRGRINY